MNVSDLLQDSPSQHRRRPPALHHESPPPTQSTPASVPSAPASPQSQHQLQHPHTHQHPPPVSQAPYPPQPSPYYPSHPSFRPDPPIHRITPRPPSQIQPSSIDPTPAMASLQHPSPSAPPPHVHPHTSWGPPPAPRQGSSPLAVSNLGSGPASHHTRASHHQQPPQIKPAMPGSDRSPVVQRGHASGSSTPSNIAAHSPPSKPLLTTAAGVLILDKRTADEQMARPAVQVQAQAHGPPSVHSNTSPGAGFKPGREREKEWERERERQQEDMDFIRHAARERVVGGPFDRERERERALPSPRERSLAPPHERSSLTSPHDRPISSAHDRPIPSPHERDRPPHHMHRMSPLARAPPAQAPPPLRTPVQVQQSPPGSSHRMTIGPPPHDRIPPPNERDRMPPLPHERPPHDRDRIHPPPPFSHPHRGPPLLPGQGQFQAHPPEWDLARERERDMAVARERERELARERDLSMSVGGPPRDLVREKDLDPARDPEYGYHPDHDRAAYLRERERQRLRDVSRDQGMLLPQRERDAIPPSQRDIAIQREREREREIHPIRDRERMMERERELMVREMEGMPMSQRERDLREREMHIQRERERVAGLHREGETGPGIPPRGHDRERERDRERRTHSRMPSPHAMNIGGAGIPPLTGASTTGPGAPGPHHPPPPPHDYPRERDLQLMNERERQLAWERDREREREMDRRQYRERMPIPDRERMSMPVPERDNERIVPADRERAMAERDRAIFERERMPLSDRDRAFIERDRLDRERVMERDRVFPERERIVINDRDRVIHDRERPLPPERVVLERERVILDRPGDRERMPMRPHPFDMVERERVEAFERERERERLEAMERERGIEAASMSGAGPPRDREGDKDRMVIDVPVVECERDERPTRPGPDREVDEKRERERLELVERERGGGMDREPMNATNREGEHTEAERERFETRERLEMIQRELNELFDRDRLGGLDIVERERLGRLERESLELLERERLEMLERERLEMLERMPSAEELGKARKEREKKPFVSLGSYVWPRTPFPYYFPEWIPSPVVEEDKLIVTKVTEASSSSGSLVPSPAPELTSTATQIPTELRLTVLVPPSFLPPARPQKFRLWGGGLPPPPPFPFTASIYSFSRRRVYTDDSDVIQCAVHAGLLTWSGIARAKKEGRTIRVVLALVPTLASASGAVKSGQGDSRVGMNGITSANSHVNGTASVPRTRTSTPLPPPTSSVPSTSSSNNDPQPPGYAGGVWASRFIGGWGESFYGEERAGRGDSAGQMTSFEEAEDDGRGCVSCGWGWGHDGSAFEVISVDVVKQNAHVAPGLGIRNRAQRLAEYAQRRADILGLPLSPSPPLFDVTNIPKKRRLNVDFVEMKRAGSSEVTVIAEEARKMQAMTISFGVPDRGKSKTGIGFKYDAQVVQYVLFPHLHQGEMVNPLPPPKRRKIATAQENQADGDVEMDSADDPGRGIVLESSKDTYLITWSMHEGKPRYSFSVLGSRERLADTLSPNASQPSLSMLSISPADATPKTQVTPQLSSPSEERTTPIDDPPPSSGATTPVSGMSQEPKPKGKETDTLSKPRPIPCRPASPKHTVRVLRPNLSDDDFTFENDIIVIKGAQRRPMDDGKMAVDGDGDTNSEVDSFRMRVLRWRWYLKS